ncbi:hypothetical protein HPB48_012210 [Haemaphysalis longicornis]|uniref:Ketosynthase family 3 (KS3) domain-containing protein n=1 Tax=Haemaphysalis longicornis TaxID=44386 RepID=A0A9J6FV22_HAELO|nr:hypothetical protein HPB48_012210 [Haemaphysalis longicornis]
MVDDDIVISGFSARFPQADSLSEFGEKLYRGDDFITDDNDRWPHGITYPSGKARAKLFRDAYAEAKVDPQDVCYVEVHGTGTKVGDPEEVEAICRFFCQSPRETPLMVGSVKSNVGHAEAASGK